MGNNCSVVSAAVPDMSVARRNAMNVFPELTNYKWQDDFFNGSQHDIIAVINHDETGHLKQQAEKVILAAIFIFILLFIPCAIILANLIVIFSLLTFIVLIMFLPLFVSTIGRSWWKSLYPPPHTAVSATGVIHVCGRGIWCSDKGSYQFPLGHIVDVTEWRIQGDGDGKRSELHAILKLTNPLSFYRDGSIVVGTGEENGCYEIALRDVENPLFLQKLVMALKEDRSSVREEDLTILSNDGVGLTLTNNQVLDESSSDRETTSSILPWLETYQWEDTYFNEGEHEIVAVFDCDLNAMAATRAGLKCVQSCGFVFVGLIATPFFIGAFVVRDLVFVAIVAGQFLLVALTMGLFSSTEVATPHLAVTSKGVAYELDGGAKYLIPFNCILEISEPDYSQANLTLVNQPSFYNMAKSSFFSRSKSSASSVFTRVRLSITHVQNLLLFKELVMAMKDRERKAPAMDQLV